jgi:hypothetical protein
MPNEDATQPLIYSRRGDLQTIPSRHDPAQIHRDLTRSLAQFGRLGGRQSAPAIEIPQIQPVAEMLWLQSQRKMSAGKTAIVT